MNFGTFISFFYKSKKSFSSPPLPEKPQMKLLGRPESEEEEEDRVFHMNKQQIILKNDLTLAYLSDN